MIQGPQRWLLSVSAVLLATGLILFSPLDARATDPMEGEWEGTLTLGTRPLAFKIQLGAAKDGTWTGKIQAAEGGQYQPLDHLSVSGTAIAFRYQSPTLQARVIFSGNYQAFNDVIRGVFIAAGYDVPVQLTRVGLSPAEAAAAAADSALAAQGLAPKVINIRHHNHFAFVGRGSRLIPVWILKEDRRNINDITAADFAWDAALRWYVVDDLALMVRYYDGGLGMKDNPQYLDLFQDLGVNSATFEEFNGFEIALNAYFGDVMIRNSRLNPFLTAVVGKYDWTLARNGRGSDPVTILDEPVQGTDWGIGTGLGAEYPLFSRFVLELEWVWRYILTEDQSKWEDIENQWTNTNLWDLTFGLVVNF